MPSLPPRITSDLFYDGVWNDITDGLSQTESIEITRGASSEGNQPDPNEGSALLQNPTGKFSPKNPNSPLYGKIGRNTPIRFNVDAGAVRLNLPRPNTGSNAQALDNVALDITGDIDIRIDARLNWGDRGAANVLELAGKQETVGDQRSWRFFNYGESFAGFGGKVGLLWSLDGTDTGAGQAISTERLPVAPRRRLAVRVTLDVDNGAGGWTVKFYTAPTIAGPWQQLGEDVVGVGVTSIFSSASNLNIGNVLSQGQNGPSGSFYAAQVYSGIDGTLVADADFTSLASGTTAWTDSVGRSWSLNGDAEVSPTASRLVGEVPAWPPRRTTSGHVTVPIAPAGILRRLGSGSKPLQSAAFRSTQFNDPDAPILEYWPCEDGEEAGTITSGLDGGSSAIISGNIELAQSNDFISSAPLPQWHTSSVTMNIRSYTTTGESQMRFFMSIPSGGLTDGFLLARMNMTGSARSLDMTYTTGGGLQFSAYDADRTLIDQTGAISFNVNGRPMRFSIGLTQVGADIQITIGSLVPNAAFANVLVDTLNGATVGRVTSMVVGGPSDLGDSVFGHVTFQAAETNLFDVVEQLDAYDGEAAGTRIVRLCTEQGVAASFPASALADQITMGPQRIKKFTDLLEEAATSDQGFLLEARNAIEIEYRSLTTMYNQIPGVVLDYSAGLISPPFQPVDDDKLTKNSVVVTVDGGSSSSPQVLTSGPMSIQDPPYGVGLYDVEYTYSLENLTLAEGLAGWLLRTGTFDGLRYTRITLDLANDRVYQYAEDILSLDVGDMMRLQNLPDDLPPDDVDLIIIGYSEAMGPSEWKITFVCIPGEPYNVGSLPGTGTSDDFATNSDNRADLTSSTVLTAADTDDTSVEVILAEDSGVPWASAYPVISTNAAMRAGITGWSAQGGTLAHADAPGTPPFDTDKAAKFTSDGVATIQSILNSSSAAGTVTPSLAYYANGWIYSTVAIRARIAINWADAGNVYLSTSSGSTIAIQPGVWTYLAESMIAPASASRGAVHFSLDDSTGAATVPVDAEVYGVEARLRRDGSSVYQQFSEDDFPLALRIDGEVVRADSCIPKFHDSFFRTTASGWGTSDSGHVYGTGGGAASDYSTDATALEGRHLLTSVNVSRRTFINDFADDMDTTVFIGTDQLSTGAAITGAITGRYADTDNLYMARIEFLTTGFLTLGIRKRVGGVESSLGSVATQIEHVVGRGYGLRFYIRGSDLKAQLWDSNNGQALQRPWDLEVTDTDLTSGTLQGYRSILVTSNTNVNPTVAYAFTKNNYPQVFNVERSRNGAVKSIPVGAAVNVNEPLTTIVR